jgi:hypothetical protein
MTTRPATATLAAVAAGAALVAVAAPASAALRPTVTALNPVADATAGGQRVTVTGAGFKNVRKVLFGAKPGTHVTTVSAHKLTVLAPPHSGADVHVRGTVSASTALRRARATSSAG